MNEKIFHILVLRRDEREVTVQERKAIERALPGSEIVFTRLDPRDFEEHAKNCESLNPDAVLLPRERPIPSLAMEKGFSHITVGPDGNLAELESIAPKFKPFVPKE